MLLLERPLRGPGLRAHTRKFVAHASVPRTEVRFPPGRCRMHFGRPGRWAKARVLAIDDPPSSGSTGRPRPSVMFIGMLAFYMLEDNLTWVDCFYLVCRSHSVGRRDARARTAWAGYRTVAFWIRRMAGRANNHDRWIRRRLTGAAPAATARFSHS
jgi:hypothetical protein